MSNPTTNKPTTAVYDSSLGLGSVTKGLIPLCERAGLPREIVNSKLAVSQLGSNTSTGISNSFLTGTTPSWNNTGFPYTPNAGDPSLKFENGNKCLTFPSSVLSWGTATQKSLFIVFKHRLTNQCASGVGGVCQLLSYGSNPGVSLDLLISNTNVVTVRLGRNFGTVTLTGITLTVGVWYAMLVTMNDVPATRERIVRLYDYSTQSEVTAAGGTVITDGTTLVGANNTDTNFHINSGGSITTLGGLGFSGEIYAVAALTGLPADADFVTLYQDPVGSARGTYSPSGGLTAGLLNASDVTNTSVSLTWTRATGTGTSGTGSPTYQLYRSTDASFTPGAGSIISGATGLQYTDTNLTASTVYHYKVVATDGSSTVTYPSGAPLTIVTKKAAPLSLMCVGDSITENQNSVPNLALAMYRLGYPCNWVNRGKSGSVLGGGWSPGIGPAIYTVAITGGTPSSGKFNIASTKAGSAQQNSGNINYNASASDIQTALEALSDIGSGNVLVTGGPFPGSTVTITFRSARATDNFTLAVQSLSSTLNNSATAVFTQTQIAYSKGNLWDSFIAECLALPTLDIISFMIGTNDAYASPAITSTQHTVNLTQFCQAVRSNLVATFPTLKIVLHAPPYRTSSNTATAAETLRAYQDSIRSVASSVTGVYVGDTLNYSLFADDYNLLTDGIHPTNGAYPLLAQNQAIGLLSGALGVSTVGLGLLLLHVG